jgi:uncharacterized protein
MNMVRLAFTLAMTLLPFTAQAQSFNCRYATRPDEILICQSPLLSRLDERMSSLYFALRNRVFGRERRALEAEQAEWLRSRMACGRDNGCIEGAYRARIQQLANY